MGSSLSRKILLIITVILAVIIARYYVPVSLPGPMVHPWKYKIISGTFAFILEFVSNMKNVLTNKTCFYLLLRVVLSNR
jgi:hypothetical protein